MTHSPQDLEKTGSAPRQHCNKPNIAEYNFPIKTKPQELRGPRNRTGYPFTGGHTQVIEPSPLACRAVNMLHHPIHIPCRAVISPYIYAQSNYCWFCGRRAIGSMTSEMYIYFIPRALSQPTTLSWLERF